MKTLFTAWLGILVWTPSCSSVFQNFYTIPAHDKFSWESSRDVCSENDDVLPGYRGHEELLGLRHYMINKKITAVWLALRRTDLYKYLWVNGKEADARLTDIGDQLGYSCGILDLTLAQHDYRPCYQEGLSYICEIRNCSACTQTGQLPFNCITSGTSCYTFFCSVANWYRARFNCHKNGGNLAVLPDRTRLKQFKRFWNKNGLCGSAWTGLRREEWTVGTNQTEGPVIGLWAAGEPRDNHNCSVLIGENGQFKVKAVSCDQANTVVCVNRSDPNEITEANYSSFGSIAIVPTANITGKDHQRDNNQHSGKSNFYVIVWTLLGVLLFIIIIQFILNCWQHYKVIQLLPKKSQSTNTVELTPLTER